MVNNITPQNIEVKPNSIAIVDWFEGSAGQVDSWIAELGYHVACFINPTATPPDVDIAKDRLVRETKLFSYPTHNSFKNRPLITAIQWPKILNDLNINKAIIMLADQQQRLDNMALAKKNGIELINAIHPTATVMPDAVLHENTVLHARSFVGYRAELHAGAVLNSGAQVDHHNVLYECVRLDPGVVTAGNVVIEPFATLHTGAVVINQIRIGEGAVVGAGAVLIKDVAPYTMVVGNPARVIRDLPKS
ncbi:MAG: acetyltransferase [Magnetococcales bacterium]|nr:acetyltransferase [Magnetococcales bacterium]